MYFCCKIWYFKLCVRILQIVLLVISGPLLYLEINKSVSRGSLIKNQWNVLCKECSLCMHKWYFVHIFEEFLLEKLLIFWRKKYLPISAPNVKLIMKHFSFIMSTKFFCYSIHDSKWNRPVLLNFRFIKKQFIRLALMTVQMLNNEKYLDW